MPAGQRKTCFQFAQSGTCTFGARCKYDHANNGTSDGGSMGQSGSRFSRGRRSRPKNQSTAEALDEFFALYPEFYYNPSSSATSEFYRMCDFFHWDREDEERESARELFQDAMVKQFNAIYGTKTSDISSWQKLCRVLEILPVPENLEACREAVRSTHVNIVDLVDVPNTGKPVHIFSTERKLSEYTISTGKYFPKDNAYAGGVLRFLLRQIMNPSADRRSGGGGRKRQGRKGIALNLDNFILF